MKLHDYYEQVDAVEDVDEATAKVLALFGEDWRQVVYPAIRASLTFYRRGQVRNIEQSAPRTTEHADSIPVASEAPLAIPPIEFWCVVSVGVPASSAGTCASTRPATPTNKQKRGNVRTVLVGVGAFYLGVLSGLVLAGILSRTQLPPPLRPPLAPPTGWTVESGGRTVWCDTPEEAAMWALRARYATGKLVTVTPVRCPDEYTGDDEDCM